MLVLKRKEGQALRIDDDIVIKIVRITADCVRVGVTAPLQVHVLREELFIERKAAAQAGPDRRTA